MTGPPARTNRRGSITSSSSYSNLPAQVFNPIVVGVPKELKNHESRVGLSPSAATEYVKNGHKVVVQQGAGADSFFPDKMYQDVGCKILATAKEVYDQADMIVKVKEPVPEEFALIRRGQVLFTYFHFAANRPLTEAMMQKGAICIAYETVATATGTLPLLTPMSEIAGKMAVQEGAKYLEKPMGGCGVLLGGVPGVRPGRVLVLGGGVVGTQAAKVAAGMGADVVVVDVNIGRLRQLDEILPPNVRTLYSSSDNIQKELRHSDLVIGAVLIPGAQAPTLVSRDDLKLMRHGSVVVDVAVDQGGCVETCSVTTHEKPTFFVENVLHYCVANMPGAVPYSSTVALNNATMQYGLQIANKGWKRACSENLELRKGLNVVEGKVVCKGVAEAFNFRCDDVRDVLGIRDEMKRADVEGAAGVGSVTIRA